MRFFVAVLGELADSFPLTGFSHAAIRELDVDVTFSPSSSKRSAQMTRVRDFSLKKRRTLTNFPI